MRHTGAYGNPAYMSTNMPYFANGGYYMPDNTWVPSDNNTGHYFFAPPDGGVQWAGATDPGAWGGNVQWGMPFAGVPNASGGGPGAGSRRLSNQTSQSVMKKNNKERKALRKARALSIENVCESYPQLRKYTKAEIIAGMENISKERPENFSEFAKENPDLVELVLETPLGAAWSIPGAE